MDNWVKRHWIINGEECSLRFPPLRPLLDVLREDLDCKSVKEGCGEGECGSCSVLVNGRLVVSCLTPAGQLLDNTEILTAEGLGKTETGRALQNTFVKHGAAQCGFCIPGMLIAAYAYLNKDPVPDEYDIRQNLAGNICRCTGYKKIIEAVYSTMELKQDA